MVIAGRLGRHVEHDALIEGVDDRQAHTVDRNTLAENQRRRRQSALTRTRMPAGAL